MLTREEISRIAEKLGQGQKVLSYDLSDKTDEAIGYLGKHLTLTLNFESGNRKLFVKSYTVSPDKEDYIGKSGIFKREREFYMILFQDMKELKGEQDWCPEYYFSKEQVLVLEDLSETGYKMAVDGLGLWALDRQHLEVAITTLAYMHATAMMLECQENKILPAMYPTILRMGILYDENKPEMPTGRWISWQVQDLLIGVDFLSKYSSEEKKFIKDNFEKEILRIYPLSRQSKKFRNTFTHGDMWKSNLLFRYSPDGIPVHCKFVDFQFIRYAPPAHDIMHLLNYTLKKSERVRDESHYLELYYRSLRSRLEDGGIVAENELPLEELLESCKEYNELALIQCILSLHYILGSVTLNIETNSLDKYEEYLNTHRHEYMRRFFDREAYADKIKDIFYELIDNYILIK